MRNPSDYISDRSNAVDASGIRKVFDLAAKMKDPVNFSIGQPDFDVPQPVKEACIEAIRAGKNTYTVTQGLPALRDKCRERLSAETFARLEPYLERNVQVLADFPEPAVAMV